MTVPASTNILDLETLADGREVPTPPTAALRILELRSDPTSGLRELSEAVRSDPALASKILATANSAFYRRGNDITSVERAISMIGRSSVITIALAFSVASSVPSDGIIGGVPMTTYWSHSVASASAARCLAAKIAPEVVEEAFLVGLISGMGRVVLGLAAPTQYLPVAEANGGWPSFRAERDELGFSSANASARLLRKWEMPALFIDAIDAVEDPAAVEDDDVRQLAIITRLAASIAEFFIDNGDSETLRLLTLDAHGFGIGTEVLDVVLDEVQTLACSIAEQFDVTLSPAEYASTIAKARAQLVEQALQTDEMWHRERERREELERSQAMFEAEARQDPLTGLANRRGFAEQMNQYLRLRLRADVEPVRPMGVVMIDVDHFKLVNDTHGHDVGDEVLVKLASVLKTITREEETMARFGGEEFVLLAPSATAEQLVAAGERLRRSIEAIEIPLSNGETLCITASLGIAVLWKPTSKEDGDKLLKAADEALYEAKDAGRNKVVLSRRNLG